MLILHMSPQFMWTTKAFRLDVAFITEDFRMLWTDICLVFRYGNRSRQSGRCIAGINLWVIGRLNMGVSSIIFFGREFGRIHSLSDLVQNVLTFCNFSVIEVPHLEEPQSVTIFLEREAKLYLDYHSC